MWKVMLILLLAAAPAQAARIAEVIDGNQVKLDDGRLIRLPATLAPTGTQPFAAKAKTTLQTFITTGTPELDPLQPLPEPDGRFIADIVIGDARASTLLLAEGLAIAYPSLPGADAAFTDEQQARRQRLGLWQKNITSPDRAGQLLNSYDLVRGRVLATAQIKNRTYLNFGPDWHTDFTVELSPKTAKQLDWQALTGKEIEVRGWIDWYFGPHLLVTESLQLTALP